MIDKWCSHCTTSHHTHNHQLHPHQKQLHEYNLAMRESAPSRFISLSPQPHAFLLERLNWSRTSAERASPTSAGSSPSPIKMSTPPSVGRHMPHCQNVATDDRSERPCHVCTMERTSFDDSSFSGQLSVPATCSAHPEGEITMIDELNARCCESHDPEDLAQSADVSPAGIVDRCQTSKPLSHLKRTRKWETVRQSSARSVWSAAWMTPILVMLTVFAACALNPIRGVAAGTEIMLNRHLREVKSVPVDQRPDENGICTSRDIRNFANSTDQLRGCRIIEGFLIMTLIENFEEMDPNVDHFPELVEITEYLLVYHVKGLRTLSNVFPNLRVIRGNQLLLDFALVFYENSHMHEIGLRSLSYIARGNVRITNNPLLCYAENIDWAAIAANTVHSEHIVNGNKKDNECPLCPSGGKNADDPTALELNCPVSPIDPRKRLCWNRQNCQKICPAACGNRTCTANGTCCDESCVSGCETRPNSDKWDVCLSCRYLRMKVQGEITCVDKCPDGYFNFNDFRCVTELECRNRMLPFSVSVTNLNRKPFIPFDGLCKMTCPIDFLMVEDKDGERRCAKCNGQCKKECGSGTIDSIATAQKFRGCNRIVGNLLIQIRNKGGLNVVKELVTALSELQEITGTLKIVRSVSIVSLSFFKRLTRIGGLPENPKTPEENVRYALYVMDNQNLQELFPNNVTIENGKLFFHFNPKLCYANIVKLVPHVLSLKNQTPPAEEVAPNSNGDKVACNIRILRSMATDISEHAAILLCEAMKFPDERVLLGYVLHSIPTLYKNVTYYDGRDGCGGDGWRVEDISVDQAKGTHFNVLLSRLMPYTQYAYYIRTYTIASQMDGGQTAIEYLTTDPAQPDPVMLITAEVLSDSEITVSWSPNVKFWGKPHSFIIKATVALDDYDLLAQRNYCDEPLGPLDEPARPVSPPLPEIKTELSDNRCECEQTESGIIRDEHLAEQMIEFENAVQNAIFVRRVYVQKGEAPPKGVQLASSPLTRRRREMMVNGNSTADGKEMADFAGPGDDHVFPNIQKDDKKTVKDVTESKKEGDFYTYVYMVVPPNVTHVTLKGLEHYSQYTIQVKACREGSDDRCGMDMHAVARTRKNENADIVTSLTVEQLTGANATAGSVILRWPVPVIVNGIIVTYTVRYQRVDLEHSTGTDMCITHTMYTNKSGEYVIKSLENGNYSFTVMSTSFAGPGPWSPPTYIFISAVGISVLQWFLIVIGTILAVALVAGISFGTFRFRYGRQGPDMKLIASVNPEYVSMQYTPDHWELERDRVTLLGELGQGSFGMVYQGTLKDKVTNELNDCAIKTVNENATDRERINFLKEAAVMKAFDTHHVVRLLGVVSNGQPTLVVMELMMGDLKGFLRQQRPEEGGSVAPTFKQIMQMAIEIADGMAYLSAKKFVHRDLAARNCMVASDMTVKIGDFGMTRDIYETDYYRKGTKGLLPVRWMSPESLKDGVFSTSSDVFSYGVVLWEMATLASQPYQGLSNDQVLKYVIDGGVMERPENCPEELYKLMCKSWQHRPTSRPSFLQIVQMMLDYAQPDFRLVSFYHTTEGQDLLNYRQRKLQEDATTPLRANEEDSSVGTAREPLEPQFFVAAGQQKGALSESQTAALAHSPLRSSVFGLRRLTADSIPDIASHKINRNSPSAPIVTAALASMQQQQQINQPGIGTGRTHGTGSINRGIEFLRNAFFGYGSPGTSAAATNAPQYTIQTHNDTSNGSSNGSHDLPMRRFATPEQEHLFHTVDPHRHLPASDWRDPAIISSTPIEPVSLDKYATPSLSIASAAPSTGTTSKPNLPRNGFRLHATSTKQPFVQPSVSTTGTHLTQPIVAPLQTTSITTTSQES